MKSLKARTAKMWHTETWNEQMLLEKMTTDLHKAGTHTPSLVRKQWSFASNKVQSNRSFLYWTLSCTIEPLSGYRSWVWTNLQGCSSNWGNGATPKPETPENSVPSLSGPCRWSSESFLGVLLDFIHLPWSTPSPAWRPGVLGPPQQHGMSEIFASRCDLRLAVPASPGNSWTLNSLSPYPNLLTWRWSLLIPVFQTPPKESESGL